MSDSISRLARESEELEKRDRKRAEFTKKAAESLKPCPFCGGSDALSVEFNGYVSIACGDCGGEWSPCFPGADSDSEKSFAEAVRLWNERIVPLRHWKAGSKPPNGFYWFFTDKNQTICLIEDGKAIMNDRNKARPVSFYFDMGHQIYGPIPEPEEGCIG
jgi:hypothetical protein